MMRQSDAALRQDFQMTEPRLMFDALPFILLTEEELIDVSFTSFIWMFEYFNSLEVNSEGSRIFRGREITLDASQATDSMNLSNLRLIIPTREDFFNFEINRWRISQFAHYVSLGLMVAAGVLIAFKMTLPAILLLLIAFLVYFVSQYNLTETLSWIIFRLKSNAGGFLKSMWSTPTHEFHNNNKGVWAFFFYFQQLVFVPLSDKKIKHQNNG